MNLPTKKILPALFVFALLGGDVFASSDALAVVKKRKKRKAVVEQPAPQPAETAASAVQEEKPEQQ